MSTKRPSSVRVGILGAARIGANGLVHPAKSVSGVEAVAVASRSEEKAKEYAGKHDLPKWFNSYDALIEDPEIDAVYVALPTAFHKKWTLHAIENDKHVLCEKPLAENADQANVMLDAAHAKGLVLVEGMHFHFLDILRKQRELVKSGRLGAIKYIRSDCAFPRIPMVENDFRLSFELGGGAGLDLGCYAVHMLRAMLDAEPVVRRASARVVFPNVDRWLSADLAMEGGARGRVTCGFRGFYRERMGVTIKLDKGWMKWSEGGLKYKYEGRTQVEAVEARSTYESQLEAFVAAIQGNQKAILDPKESVCTLRVIDSMYAKAGLAGRGSHAAS